MAIVVPLAKTLETHDSLVRTKPQHELNGEIGFLFPQFSGLAATAKSAASFLSRFSA